MSIRTTVDSAAQWPTTHFVGLDIAPVLLPLSRFLPSLTSRLRFVQHDFLSFPFPSDLVAAPGSSAGTSISEGPFDLIRLSHIGFGVPEEAWQDLLDECARLLDPCTGWIQVIESGLPALLDTESRQWRAEVMPAGAVDGLAAPPRTFDSPEMGKLPSAATTVGAENAVLAQAQARTAQIEKLGAASELAWTIC